MGYNDSTAAGCLAAIVASLGVIGVWFLLSLLFAWPIQLLWNWLVPSLFSGPEVTIIEAFGLELLSGLLLGRSSYNNTSTSK